MPLNEPPHENFLHTPLLIRYYCLEKVESIGRFVGEDLLEIYKACIICC